MTRLRRQFLLKVFTLSDLAIMTVSFALAALVESYLTAHVSFGDFLSMRIKLQNIVLFLGLLAIWHGVFSAVGLYQSKRLEARRNEVKDVLTATSIGTLLLIVAGALFRIRMITPIFLAGFWLTEQFDHGCVPPSATPAACLGSNSRPESEAHFGCRHERTGSPVCAIYPGQA